MPHLDPDSIALRAATAIMDLFKTEMPGGAVQRKAAIQETVLGAMREANLAASHDFTLSAGGPGTVVVGHPDAIAGGATPEPAPIQSGEMAEAAMRAAFEERHEYYIFPSEDARRGALNEFAGGWFASQRAIETPGILAPQIQSAKCEPAPPHGLPKWSECSRIIENHEFRERAKAGLEGQVIDTAPSGPEPTELHRFIYEYDDSDSYTSAWFLHRLEKVLVEARLAAIPAQKQASSEQNSSSNNSNSSQPEQAKPTEAPEGWKLVRRADGSISAEHKEKGFFVARDEDDSVRMSVAWLMLSDMLAGKDERETGAAGKDGAA